MCSTKLATEQTWHCNRKRVGSAVPERFDFSSGLSAVPWPKQPAASKKGKWQVMSVTMRNILLSQGKRVYSLMTVKSSHCHSSKYLPSLSKAGRLITVRVWNKKMLVPPLDARPPFWIDHLYHRRGGKKADKYIAWELQVTAVSGLFSIATIVFWEVEEEMEQGYHTTYITHSQNRLLSCLKQSHYTESLHSRQGHSQQCNAVSPLCAGSSLIRAKNTKMASVWKGGIKFS